MIHKKPGDLFGYTSLPADSLTLLLCLQVIFGSTTFFSDDTTSDASAMLAVAARTFKTLPPKRQTRYARTLTLALKSGHYAPSLRRACVIVSKWPCIGTFPPWQGAMEGLNHAMSQADVQLRADVWWSLLDDVENHSPVILNGGQRIAHLLTPIPGRMSAEQIINVLPKELREKWKRDSSHRAHGSARRIMECFDKLDGVDAESSKKRKRDRDKVKEVIGMLKKNFPDMKCSDSVDILPGLMTHVRKSVVYTLARRQLTIQAESISWNSRIISHRRLSKDSTRHRRR